MLAPITVFRPSRTTGSARPAPSVTNRQSSASTSRSTERRTSPAWTASAAHSTPPVAHRYLIAGIQRPLRPAHSVVSGASIGGAGTDLRKPGPATVRGMRVLMSMPLHAVTEVYGEAGVRERFALEIARFDAADLARVDEGLALAGELHRADLRVREAYVNHLLRVTIRIIRYYRVDDVDVLVAALLHD